MVSIWTWGLRAVKWLTLGLIGLVVIAVAAAGVLYGMAQMALHSAGPEHDRGEAHRGAASVGAGHVANSHRDGSVTVRSSAAFLAAVRGHDAPLVKAQFHGDRIITIDAAGHVRATTVAAAAVTNGLISPSANRIIASLWEPTVGRVSRWALTWVAQVLSLDIPLHVAGSSGATFRDCDVCPEMVVIRPGSFLMGSPWFEAGRDADESPRRLVTIGRHFAVGRYEVTWQEWDACVADGGCSGDRRDEGWGRGRRPVIYVSWDDAKAYVAWLAKRTGEPYRLLSEAEWEYAARGGTTGRWSFDGDASQLCDYANHADQSTTSAWKNQQCSDGIGERTAPVGSFRPNSLGLFDMHGNVWEWVEDCWHDNYVGAPTGGSAWTSEECNRRVLRGGSWGSDPQILRSAYRNRNSTVLRLNFFGFRVGRTLTP